MTGMLTRLARRLGVRVYCLLSRPLHDAPSAPPPGVALRLVPEEEMLARCADPDFGFPRQKAAAAYSRGELCVAAFAGNALAGHVWFASAPAPHTDGLWMAFDGRAVYTYRAFVGPRYRGLGIAPALYRFADRIFLERGRSAVLLCVERDNVASLRAAQRSGARPVGYCAYLRAGPLFLHWRTPGARRVDFRFVLPR